MAKTPLSEALPYKKCVIGDGSAGFSADCLTRARYWPLDGEKGDLSGKKPEFLNNLGFVNVNTV
jgi:hypothetical protein